MGIKSIFHININCSNIKKSVEFYSDQIGLHATPITIPEHLRSTYDPAIKKILDLKVDGRVDFEPYFLGASDAQDTATIDLIQWNAPKYSGRAYEQLNNLGIARIALLVDDIDAMYRRLVSNGIDCLSEPRTLVADSGDKFRCVAFRDPDGTVMEFVQTVFPPPAGAKLGARKLFHVNINCSDLKTSIDFYRDTLGMQALLQTGFSGSQDLGELLSLGEPASADVCLLATEEGAEGTLIDLVEWKKPRVVGTPHKELTNLGMPRMAFLADDVDAMHENLSHKGVRFRSDPVTIHFDPPLGKIRAVCFYDPDGTSLELFEMNYTK